MQRSDPLSIQFRQLFHDLAVADIVDIHIRNKDHTGQVIFFAQIPCLLGSNLHARFSGNDDHRRVRCAGSLLSLADKIKEARGIQNIDLILSPHHRNHRCGNRKLAFDLLFIKITDGISVAYFSQAVGDTRKISHRFRQRCLAGAAMSKQDHISDSVSSKNVHM